MGLVLSLKSGQDFYVGDQRFIVTDVYSETHFRIVQHSTGRTFEITPDRNTRILDDVFVFGARRRAPRRVNVTIDAPRDQGIRRGR